jgi:hypothetical protein
MQGCNPLEMSKSFKCEEAKVRRICGGMSRYEWVLDTRIVLKYSGGVADATDQHKTTRPPGSS